MKKINALYDFLISQLDVLCSADSIEIEEYCKGLTQEQISLFDGFFERLGVHRDSLVEAVACGEIYSEFDALHSLFKDFSLNFNACPVIELERINFVLCIAKKISGFTSSVADEDVASGLGFFLASLDFASKAFSTNAQVFERNIVWFKICDQCSLDSMLSMVGSVELLYVILMFSSEFDFSHKNDVVICRDVNTSIFFQRNVLTLLRLHLVSVGEKINKVTKYPSRPVNSSVNKFDPSLAYAQFVEVVGILGEYVERDDALSKFLSIYHVVENFMFRAPIVKLERSSNGAMFSIRDFKRLYKGVDINELGALEELVKSAFLLSHLSVTFGDFAVRSWISFRSTNAMQANSIDDFLGRVQGSPSYSVGNFYKYFASLVYKVRCSIVHNKETEYHISSENYAGGCQLIFEGYLLPVLEEFVFLLLCEENSLVWYRAPSIALWDSA